MKVEQFTLERMQSIYENQVDINLSESGVAPLKLSELVDDSLDRDALLAEALRYTQSNGTLPLRTAIAALYPGATCDHVQVTSGGSEANFITMWNLVEPKRSRDRHQRPVEGIRTAGASHRMGRRPAGAAGVALVVSRLHDHCSRRVERLPGAACARAVTAGAYPDENESHPEREFSS